MDVWLIVLAVVIPVLVLALSTYLLIYYQHPDDKNVAYWPKFLVVVGLSLCMVGVLLVPFDVSNLAGVIGCGSWSSQCGGLALGIVWQVFYLLVAVMVVLLIPYTIFYYESYDPESTAGSCRRLCNALAWQLVSTVIAILVLVILWVYLSIAEIPVTTYKISSNDFASCTFSSAQGNLLSPDAALGSSCVGGVLDISLNHTVTPSSWKIPTTLQEIVVVPTTFLIFLTCVFSFAGWFFFTLYAGIGMVALPYDMIQSFRHRPTYMPRDMYAMQKISLAKRSKELLELGKEIRAKRQEAKEKYSKLTLRQRLVQNREARKTHNQFKQAVLDLESQFEDLTTCHDYWKEYNPLVSWAKLMWGIIGVILSLCWVLQIVIFILIRDPYPNGNPAHPFLNELMTWASRESGFALLGVVFIALFSMYLFFCVLKGNTKFGLRFLLVELHPMKFGETYMSSFLVNVSLLLLCTPPLIQFTSTAFSDYVILTDIDSIFGQQIRHMRFFKYFFANNVFVISILAISLITLIWICLVPSSEVAKAKAIRERIAKFKAANEAESRRTSRSSATATEEQANQAEVEMVQVDENVVDETEKEEADRNELFTVSVQ